MFRVLSKLFEAPRRQHFERERLTMRILADVDDVDPTGDVPGRLDDAENVPTVRLVAEWFAPNIDVQLCLQQNDGTLQWLTEENIDPWKVSRQELFAIAIENLNAVSLNATLYKTSVDGGTVYSPMCEGIFRSSLLFASKLFDDFNFDRQDLIAAIPNRDSLHFCARSSPESVVLLREMCSSSWDDEDCPRKYRISKSFFVPSATAAFGWKLLQN